MASTSEQLTRSQAGWGGWTFDPKLARSAGAAAANVAYFGLIGVPAGSTITNLGTILGVLPVGTNPTAIRMGVLLPVTSSTAKCIAVTADVGTAWKSATTKVPTTAALTAPLPVGRDTALLIGLWMEGSYGTTQPSLYWTTADNEGAPLGSNPPTFCNISATGADLVVGTTYNLLQTAAVAPFFGWS